MASFLFFLPRLFQFFGVFRNFIGFIQPIWPNLARFWNRQAAVA